MKNTTDQGHGPKNNVVEFVENEETSSSIPQTPSDHVEVLEQFVDQDSQRYARLRQGWLVAICPHSLFTSPSPWDKLQKLTGITVISSSTKSALLEQFRNGSFTPAYCVKRNGWNGQHFACADQIFTPENQKAKVTVVSSVSKHHKFTSKGTVDGYWKPLVPLIKDQELMLFAYGPAFLGPILEIMAKTEWSVQNPFFDVCGAPGRGKTTIIILLAGSVWGTGSPPLGFGESWNFTEGGIEEHMVTRNDGLLQLDEGNKARQGNEGPEHVIPKTVFSLADGVSKRRHHTFGPEQPNCRVVVVSTSNDPLSVVGSKRKAEAIAARCISINIPDNREHGMLSYIPEGIDDAATVIERLTMLALTNYGTPIRHFLDALVNARYDDETALIAKISQYAQEFIDAIGKINYSDRRRAKPFALAYAAARLARDFGALPKKKDIGSLKTAFVKVWAMTSPILVDTKPARAPAEVLRAYVRQHKHEFVKLGDISEMSDKELDRCAGFRRKGVDGRRELIFSKGKFGDFSFNADNKRALKRDGHLIADERRYDAKRTVRLVDGKRTLEPVYVVNLTSLLDR